jgi:hypothetical protein
MKRILASSLRSVTIRAALVVSFQVSAWSGYDWETNSFVDIDKGNLVRQGREIEYYEYGNGYRSAEVESIRRYGSSVDVEVRDSETGQLRTFDMDD